MHAHPKMLLTAAPLALVALAALACTPTVPAEPPAQPAQPPPPAAPAGAAVETPPAPAAAEPIAPTEPEPVCTATPQRTARWVDTKPRVPLAIVEPDGGAKVIRTPPKACCSAWLDRERRWTTVDAYGQPVGRAVLSSSHLYDVTDCHEMTFEQVEGEPGVGLHVAVDSGYVAPPSVRWTPTAAQRAQLEAMAKQIRGLLAIPPPNEELDKPLPFAQRVIYARQSTRADARQLAIVGGQFLAVAEWWPDAGWRLIHLDLSEGLWPIASGQVYQPIAAFDMNNDGSTEAVVHVQSAGGERFGDVVIGVERYVNPVWRLLARSVGGAFV